jgi:pimeloyl-ACP methyl ester carboxylesterase
VLGHQRERTDLATRPNVDIDVDDAAEPDRHVRAETNAPGPEYSRAVVVGESFGGAVAMSFALTRPEQVSALVVQNSFPHFAPQFRLRLARYGLGLIPWGMMAVIRRLLRFVCIRRIRIEPTSDGSWS